MSECVRCGSQVHNEPAPDGAAVWVDNTGGDVCGWDGGNEPHETEGVTALRFVKRSASRAACRRFAEKIEAVQFRDVLVRCAGDEYRGFMVGNDDEVVRVELDSGHLASLDIADVTLVVVEP